jgi:DNA-binding transcriptional ArsR family regulator
MVEYRSQRLDRTYGAIAHPVRRQILARLRQGEAKVTELAAPFPMSLAAVSKHIRVLEEADLIKRSVAGRDHYLAINAKPLRTASSWLEDYREFWDRRLDGLEALLHQRRRK